MKCHDCPDMDAATMRARDPDWTPRLVCCLDRPAVEALGLDQRDDNAARSAAALRDLCPPGTPLHNRKARRHAAAKHLPRQLR